MNHLDFSPDFSIENKIGNSSIICGIDEVGRGPLAGPVVASAVILPRPLPASLIGQINDSKKIPAKKRALLYRELHNHAYIGIGESSVEEIDKINILQATLKAMQRAFNNLCDHITPNYALIDGNKSPELPCKTQTVIKGDQHSLSIAAASIIAKHYRDEMMTKLAVKYPHYSWETNAGYGTKAHIEGMQLYGITNYHRRSFSPVSKLILQEKNTSI